MAWGLEIQPDRLRLCEAKLARSQVRITRSQEVGLPPGLVQPSLTAANVRDAAGLAALLGRMARDAGCRGWVHAALPDEVFSLRTILTDQVPAQPSEARRFLCWQARDLLPFPAEEARLDFLPGLPGPDGRQRVVCLIARERVLAEYEQLMADARLQAVRVDARSIALAQAASRRLGRRAAGLLAFGSGRMTLLVVEDARPRFWRTLALAEPLQGAERERLIREVADSLAFCREAEGTRRLEHLLLDGPDALTGGLAPDLADWLEIPVSALQATAFGLTQGATSIHDIARWGAAIGAAIAPC